MADDHKATTASELLCFDKNEFMKTNFSVDEFLHKHGKVPSLEQLRDNLGCYLKFLRSSMIDLINEDYADFVSLSANLVGLDQSIYTIREPLEKFRNEIEDVQELIQDNENDIRDHLEQKQKLNELKRNLQCLKKVGQTIKKLEELMANRISENIRPDDLERAALEFIQLKYNSKFCEEYLQGNDKAKLQDLEDQVHRKLRKLFNESLKTATTTSVEQLERCLRIYITLDAGSVAEQVFREDIVAPYMSSIITEHNLQNSPQGLVGVYTKILNFISLHMTDILRLTLYTDKLRGFNFLLNSYWIDIEMRLETYMSSIFAPGNSEIFYVKYKCTQDFLSKIEGLLSSPKSVKEFRQHKRTKLFHSRWNLAVYFQICFQDIAGQFESALDPLMREDCFRIHHPSSTEFKLIPFQKANTAFERCWAKGVYLSEVFPKFYKLSVQIVLRLSRWISDVITNHIGNSCEFPFKVNRTEICIALYADIQKFIDRLGLMQEIVIKSLPKEKEHLICILDTITKSFTNLQHVLFANLVTIQGSLVSQLITECSSVIRQVNDLPRLYRKTNRDIPSKSSAYIEQMLKPLKSFANEHSKHLGQDIAENILAQVCSRITADFHVAVTSVLTSVKKTEESLRRLRNVKSSQLSTAIPASTGSVVSDDDKIRLQLRIDVIEWSSELESIMDFKTVQIDKLVELNNIVNDIQIKE